VVPTEPIYTTAGYYNDDDDSNTQQRKKFSMTPLSPTHYQQPPTPEHPPPPPHLAEKCIHERIRPLSQEYKRRSLAMSAGREFELAQPMSTSAPMASFMTPSLTLGASNGSLSSSVSLSDRSASTDCVEEFIGDAPFAGESFCFLSQTALFHLHLAVCPFPFVFTTESPVAGGSIFAKTSSNFFGDSYVIYRNFLFGRESLR
jgi:hypothetical protein